MSANLNLLFIRHAEDVDRLNPMSDITEEGKKNAINAAICLRSNLQGQVTLDDIIIFGAQKRRLRLTASELAYTLEKSVKNQLPFWEENSPINTSGIPSMWDNKTPDEITIIKRQILEKINSEIIDKPRNATTTYVVVADGDVISLVADDFASEKQKSLITKDLENCSITIVSKTDSGKNLLLYNFKEHLADKSPYSKQFGESIISSMKSE